VRKSLLLILSGQCSDVNKDWTCKDQDKDKDQAYKDQDKDKDWTCKDKDKDLNLVLKESLRTRTRINITGPVYFNNPAQTLMKTCSLFIVPE